MTVNEHVANLLKLVEQGHGNLQVYASHGASGAVDPVGYSHVSNYVGDSGPFDLEDGENYVSMSTGY